MRRTVDGLLLLDKPAGPGSNAVLQAARRLFAARKAGHAGTLDPLASGLLPLLFGEATKFASYASDATKTYEASVRLGRATSTGDAEGEIIREAPVALESVDLPAVLSGFEGEIQQVPPMYSALKRDGQPLYELARKGLSVDRAPRSVRIERLELLDRGPDTLRLRIVCSKGTYVRTLAEDLGVALGTCAHLAGLRRTAVGPWRVDQATRLTELEALATGDGLDALLLPVEALVATLPRIDLDAGSTRRFRLGQSLEGQDGPPGAVSVHGATGAFIGVGERGQGTLRPRRLLGSDPV